MKQDLILSKHAVVSLLCGDPYSDTMQVVHIYVPLFTKQEISIPAKGGDPLTLSGSEAGKVTASLTESGGRLCRVFD